MNIKYKKYKTAAAAVAIWAITPLSATFGQSAAQPTPSPSDMSKTSDEAVETLSPFVISASNDESYTAKDTLAGNRTRTNLADVGSSVSVVTQKFLEDTASKSAADLLVYTTSTEVSGQGGNFLGQGNGAILTNPPSLIPITRVRGVDAADLTTDFFLTGVPFDTYNTDRVDIQRGPNAILFGIGSPGGIINATSQDASFTNSVKLENQIGSFGSVRYTANANLVLLPDELSIRLAYLNDDTKYREYPAFKDDHRLYGALRFDPHWLNKGSAHTSITANVEHGSIRGNAPLDTPPLDAITPYFNSGAFTNPDGTHVSYQATNPNGPFYGQNAQATNPWITYTPGGQYMVNGEAFEANGQPQGVTFFSQGHQWPNPNLTNLPVTAQEAGIATYDVYASQAGLYGSSLGAFKAKSLTDASIFNFYDNLISGPNSSENDTFNTITVNLSQTFLNNRLGFDASFNHQTTLFANDSFFPGSETEISIDLMNQYGDGQPNPNVGRPYIAGGPGIGNWTNTTRDTARITGFAELNASDFMSQNSLLTHILGRHVFTGLIDHYQNSSDTRSYYNDYIADNPENWQSLYQTDVYRGEMLNTLTYLGPNAANRTTASGLNLSPVTGVMTYAPTTMSEFNDVTGTWVDAPIDLINNASQPNSSKVYTSGTLTKYDINSEAITWQGYLFDGTVVPFAGYRTDSDGSRQFQTTLIPGTTWVNVDPGYYNLASTPKSYNSGHSDTYSLVLHLPNFVRSKLPGNFDISPFYNQSSNFQPEAGRIDVNGNPLASPTGKTREFGVVLSALNDKVSLKLTRYKTSADNVTIGADTGLASYVITAYAWGQASYGAISNPTLTTAFSSFQRHPNGTTSSGQTLYFWPDGVTGSTLTQSQIDAEYQVQQATLAVWGQAYPNGGQLPANIQKVFGMAGYTNPATYASVASGNPGLAVTGDTTSQGDEIELSANPISGLTVSVTAAYTAASEGNVAASFQSFFLNSQKLFNGPAGELPMFGGYAGNYTTKSWFEQYAAPSYYYYQASQGTSTFELRPWRVNTVADYGFHEGILKGLHFGGGYRWEDKIVTGYPVVTVNSIETYDTSHPYYGSTIGKVDAWIGYKRLIDRKRNIYWRTQLNVRNLFPTNNLSVVTSEPDGSPAAMMIPEPRTITWTNTLEFLRPAVRPPS